MNKELERLALEISKGIFDNNTLRQVCEIVGAGNIRTLSIQAINCSDCKKISYAKTLRSCYGGLKFACPDCAKSYSYCSECSSLILLNDTSLHFHVDDLNRRVADNQVDRFDADITARRGAKPKSTTKDKGPKWGNLRYFGIEIELERRTDILVPPDTILKAKYSFAEEGIVMVKHDGSLGAAPDNPRGGTNGFEVVSLPCTLDYHKTQAGWSRFFEVMGPWMQSSPPTTGLHVHVSANSMTRGTVGKIVRFMNEPGNLEFLKNIANRDFTRPNPNGRVYANVYPNAIQKVRELVSRRRHQKGCRNSPAERVARSYYRNHKAEVLFTIYGHPILQRTTSDFYSASTCNCPPGQYDYGGHYAAFNVRTNKPTIEFRMFQGSTDEGHFWAALEFCDSIVNFCESHSFDEMNWKNFISWFKTTRHLHKYLARWLVVSGYIEPLKKDK